MTTENKEPFIDTIEARDEARVVVVKELFGNIYTAPVDKTALRHRAAVIRRVRADWIIGLLYHSLANVAKLELKLTPDQASVSWGLAGIVQAFNSSPTRIEPGTHIADIFDRYEQAILILGAPGTGKTTLLLELAERLLDRAAADPSLPVPIVFNLSSWSLSRPPLARWFVSEMNQRNDIPRSLATEWIADDNIIPLLDGLDEVDPAHRDACLQAINHYRSEHGLVPIAVCSRTDDYRELEGKLRLRAAVVVEPLTDADVDRALFSTPELAQLKHSVLRDPILAEMLRTPLMLWIAAMAYRGAVRQVDIGSNPAEMRERLFSAYVEAMFTRKPTFARYSDQNVLRWLTLLARAMTAKRLTIFSVESLHPGFDPRPHRKLLAYPFAVIGTVLIYVAFCYAVAAAGYGLSGLLINTLVHFKLIAREAVDWKEQLEFAETVGFMASFLSAPICLILAPFTTLTPSETIDFSFRNLGKRLPSAIATMVILLIVLTLTWALIDIQTYSFSAAIAEIKHVYSGNGWTLITFPPYQALVCGLLRLFIAERPLLRSRSNQGTRRSLLAALCVTTFTLCLGLTLALKDGLVQWLILCPLLAGLAGGIFAFRNYVLLFYLWLTRLGPLRYTSFLDEATQRIFLTRVGGSYVFKHRMLQEYLGNLPIR